MTRLLSSCTSMTARAVRLARPRRRLAVFSGLALALGLLAAPASASNTARFEPEPLKSHLTIDGTSTLHDWQVKGSQVDGSIEFAAADAAGAAKSAEKLLAAGVMPAIHVTVPVTSIKGEESGLNKKMYGALKSDKHPDITFESTSVKVETPPASAEDPTRLTVAGKLTIAGESRDVTLTVDVRSGDADHTLIQVTAPIKMTDYKVDPPTAMLGFIKSGDDVTVKILWRLERTAAAASAPAAAPAR